MLACYHTEMQMIPAVDVLGQDAVRLAQGDYERVLFRVPLAPYVRQVIEATHPTLLHVVDLQGARDGAFRPELLPLLGPVTGGVRLQLSGGVRTITQARALLDAGASRIIMGTAAFAHPDAMAGLVDALGAALVVALDVKDGRVASHGWTSATDWNVTDALAHCQQSGVTRLHVTAVARDGSMTGPDLDLYREVCAAGFAVVAAGGVRDDADLAALERLGCEAAVMGTALAQRLGVVMDLESPESTTDAQLR
jgi:phosphoribosylformimino-5-aminoimidazole carboxamide ribotide isomerase